MILFLKENQNFFIFLALLLLTIDSFMLIIKYRNSLESRPNLKISYDILKSYCVNYSSEYNFLIISLTIENNSSKSIDIMNIKLIDAGKSYFAVFPKMKDEFSENDISLINISSKNILRESNIASYNSLDGYACFENVDPILNAKNFKIIIETPNNNFEKEIIINPLDNEFLLTNNPKE